jgi:methyl-accepting chemotaxis protein
MASEITSLLRKINIDFIQIVDNDGTVLYRSHQPDNFGDDVSGQKSVGLALRGQTATSVEAGSFIPLSVKASAPMTDADGKIAAVVIAGYDLCKDNAFVDRLKTMYDADFTLFRKDTRVSTTLVQDGQRLVNTQLSQDLSDMLLNAKQEFHGDTLVAGQPYYAAYKPLLDYDGAVMGILFAGTTKESVVGVSIDIMQLIVIISVVLIAIIFVFFTLYLNTYIAKPIKQVASAIGAMSGGDFSVRLSDRMLNNSNEIGEMGRALSVMVESLSTLIKDVVDMSGSVSSASKEISDASTTLANHIANQASDVLAVVATITDVALQTKAAETNAREVSVIASNTKDLAETGNNSMRKMLDAMEQINVESENISKIIKVIDGIAFQTNILALNASVEAARAGVHGKGFAVVAEEVRNLAARSAEAVNDTSALIQRSIACVKDGSDIAHETAGQLSDIMNDAQQVSLSIEGIFNEMTQQAVRIQSLQTNMESMNGVIQANSAISQQTSAAAEGLLNNALDLTGSVSGFKLGGGGDGVNKGGGDMLSGGGNGALRLTA